MVMLGDGRWGGGCWELNPSLAYHPSPPAPFLVPVDALCISHIALYVLSNIYVFSQGMTSSASGCALIFALVLTSHGAFVCDTTGIWRGGGH